MSPGINGRPRSQAGDGRLEDLAPLERREPIAQGRRRCHLPRRDRGPRPNVRPRRLTAASPNFRHSSGRTRSGANRGGLGRAPVAARCWRTLKRMSACTMFRMRCGSSAASTALEVLAVQSTAQKRSRTSKTTQDHVVKDLWVEIVWIVTHIVEQTETGVWNQFGSRDCMFGADAMVLSTMQYEGRGPDLSKDMAAVARRSHGDCLPENTAGRVTTGKRRLKVGGPDRDRMRCVP